ncbi:MAG TPA: tetratricopeptide repeat protein [Bacteroidota bacterium]|nr:tetratricopeptide repeat protein [Bacteroidota bacterium]
MRKDPSSVRFPSLLLIPATLALGMAVGAVGCGSSEEETEGWEQSQPTSTTGTTEATPATAADSMKNESRRLKEQIDALAAENRTLTARNAELETKLNEAATKAAAAPAPAAGTTTAAPVGDVSGAYNAALDTFRKKNFQDAASQFEAIINSGTDKLVDNCHYWIGESYYGMKKYDEAIKQFETVLGYSGSGKRPYAQLMIGNSYMAMGDKAAAKDAYSKLVNTYPTSSLVEKAKEKLAKLQ